MVVVKDVGNVISSSGEGCWEMLPEVVLRDVGE